MTREEGLDCINAISYRRLRALLWIATTERAKRHRDAWAGWWIFAC